MVTKIFGTPPTAVKLTQPQFKLIRELFIERKWEPAVTGPQSMMIKVISRADDYESVPTTITKMSATDIIKVMLKADKKPPIALTSGLSNALNQLADPLAKLEAAIKPLGVSMSEFYGPTINDYQTIAKSLPLSKYAVLEGGVPYFYEIVERPDGRRWINRLIGAPGSWKKIKISLGNGYKRMCDIAVDPKSAALLYAQLHKRCAVCSSPLSNEKSLIEGMGPVCSSKFN